MRYGEKISSPSIGPCLLTGSCSQYRWQRGLQRKLANLPKARRRISPSWQARKGAFSCRIHRYSITAVAKTCWTVKVASASMARISSGDCCGGATVHTAKRKRTVSAHRPCVWFHITQPVLQARSYVHPPNMVFLSFFADKLGVVVGVFGVGRRGLRKTGRLRRDDGGGWLEDAGESWRKEI